jgi:hypothetical protein
MGIFINVQGKAPGWRPLRSTAPGLLLAVNIERLSKQLLEQPDDPSRQERLNKDAQLGRTLPFEVNLWKTQNICHKLLHVHCPKFKEKVGLGDQNAQEWLRHCTVLAENFLLRVPIWPGNSKPANG